MAVWGTFDVNSVTVVPDSTFELSKNSAWTFLGRHVHLPTKDTHFTITRPRKEVPQTPPSLQALRFLPSAHFPIFPASFLTILFTGMLVLFFASDKLWGWPSQITIRRLRVKSDSWRRGKASNIVIPSIHRDFIPWPQYSSSNVIYDRLYTQPQPIMSECLL